MLAGPGGRQAGAGRARLRGWALLLLLAFVVSLPVASRAQPPNQAGLVIQNGDGRLQTTCVAFPEASISGLDLLERAELDLILQPASGSAAVCSIDGEGCRFPEERCFCQCQGGGSCRYWTYWRLRDGAWQFSTVGATASRVEPGAVEGWVWGESGVDAGNPPPPISFDRVCSSDDPASPVAVATSATTAASAITPNAAQSPGAPARVRAPAGSYLLFAGALAGLLIAIYGASRSRR